MTKTLESKNVSTMIYEWDTQNAFLDWEKQRFEELEARVKPKIPLSKLPPWESVPALRLECIKRCVNDEEVAELKRMNNETKLQRWLLSRCKRKYMLLLCCKCH